MEVSKPWVLFNKPQLLDSIRAHGVRSYLKTNSDFPERQALLAIGFDVFVRPSAGQVYTVDLKFLVEPADLDLDGLTKSALRSFSLLEPWYQAQQSSVLPLNPSH